MKEFPFLMYTADDSDVTVNAILKDETIWLSQKGMAELFGCSSDNISLHLKNIFSEKELQKDSVTEKISVTAADGKKYLTQFEFLMFRRYDVLPDHNRSRISRQEALEKVSKEYDIFNRTQIINSDFDRMVKEVLGKRTKYPRKKSKEKRRALWVK